ncbi:MAG: NAD(P)/FAD-dependent oxidoreductase [Chitinophagales bacterium]|jgi:glycine/D-amino acid oxidase-like deaminating enzyme
MKILVVGQGVAGAVLALTLSRGGMETWIVDQDRPGSASKLAAGVVNPVTGKRYALSWNFHSFFPFAKQFYHQLEAATGQKIWFDYPILRMLGSPLEWNEWNLRAGKPEFNGWMTTTDSAGKWGPHIQPGFNYGLLEQAGRADFQALTRISKATHPSYSAGWLEEEAMEAALNEFDRVILCEGAFAAARPYFPEIPWNAAKGERLIIRLENTEAIEQMLKKQILLAPYGEQLFWAGANYDWNLENPSPTLEGKAFLTAEVKTMIKCPFKVEAHDAGIRPVVKDRRPVLGWSTQNPRVGIFNGMASKGALLAPFWANHLLLNLTEGQPIDPEVQVQRFKADAFAIPIINRGK